MRRLCFISLGVLLLSTAGLKGYALTRGGVSGLEWWTGPRVQLFVIGWELVLGLWLIANYRPNIRWLGATVTFAVFAGLSGFLGLRGVPSCGCFGAVNTSPWWSFAVDVAALVLLLLWRPNWTGFGQRVRAELAGTLPLAGATAVVAVVGLVAFGHLSEASDGFVARVRGDSLTVREVFVDVGAGSPGEVREGIAELTNWSNRPVRVYGGTTGCNYNILSDCPRMIPAGGSSRFRVKYRLPDEPGRSLQPAAFWAVYESDTPLSIPIVLGAETVAATE
jgi:hypothetical protein